MVSKTLPWPYKWAEAHGHSPSGVLKMAGKYCYQRKTDYWLKNVHLADRHFVKHILWKSGEFWKTTEKGHNIQQHWATSLSQHVDTTAIWESPHPTTEKERKYDRKRCTVMNCSAGKHTRTLCFVFAFYLNANWQKNDYLATGSNTDQILWQYTKIQTVFKIDFRKSLTVDCVFVWHCMS